MLEQFEHISACSVVLFFFKKIRKSTKKVRSHCAEDLASRRRTPLIGSFRVAATPFSHQVASGQSADLIEIFEIHADSLEISIKYYFEKIAIDLECNDEI